MEQFFFISLFTFNLKIHGAGIHCKTGKERDVPVEKVQQLRGPVEVLLHDKAGVGVVAGTVPGHQARLVLPLTAHLHLNIHHRTVLARVGVVAGTVPGHQAWLVLPLTAHLHLNIPTQNNISPSRSSRRNRTRTPGAAGTSTHRPPSPKYPNTEQYLPE
jgi:hypothetical protein